MKYVVKAMNVILCLFQVWIDVAYKTNDSILGLSLAVLQEYITTVNKATSGEAGPNAGVTIGLLATAAQSVYSSISSTHPGAAQIAAQTTTTEITSAGRSSFHVKLVVGDYKGVEEFLDCGIHPMAPGPLGVHPLATAVLSGAMDVIKLLVERGADVCAKSGVNGETALLCAAVAGYLDVVEFLIDKGAEVDAVSDRHNTTALLGACDQGHLDVVRFLLVDKKADLSIVDKDGFSPLMKAVAGGHEEIVELLRANGAEEILTNDGLLPSPSQVTVIARVMTGGGAIRLVVKQPGETPIELVSILRAANLQDEESE
ncbi:ankyrin repeat-containing domain protein [Aspergillus spectabilis]